MQMVETAETSLRSEFGASPAASEACRDGIPTFWAHREQVHSILGFLKERAPGPYKMLYDLTAIDERTRTHHGSEPTGDFTVVYHLFSFERNEYIRLKTALDQDALSVDTITDLWPAANWYEREVWDMFGITFSGHPHLTRILMPATWEGHPLRKDHPARATEMGEFRLPDTKQDAEQEALRFRPEEWGMARTRGDSDIIFLNIGPQHPGTHGVLRVVLQLDGEEILDCVPRDWISSSRRRKNGRAADLAYLHCLHRPHRLSRRRDEQPRLSHRSRKADRDHGAGAGPGNPGHALANYSGSSAIWSGTERLRRIWARCRRCFYTFNDRERAFAIIEAITGARMHPNWFRIGGVAQDLPRGWDAMFRDFLKYLPPRLAEYDREILRNRIFQARTKGVGTFTTDEAIDWGITGPILRACGFEWDFRKKQPYSGYEQFDFDIPIGRNGDCFDRAAVRVEEMRQSLRIIDQCVNHMPEGPYKSDHPLATPPRKAQDDARYRDADHAFPECKLGAGDSAGRSAGRHRGDQGQ